MRISTEFQRSYFILLITLIIVCVYETWSIFGRDDVWTQSAPKVMQVPCSTVASSVLEAKPNQNQEQHPVKQNEEKLVGKQEGVQLKTSGCNFPNLKIIVMSVHFEGNLGDQMETTPLLRFLKECNVKVTAVLSNWKHGQIHSNSARSQMYVDKIYKSHQRFDHTGYDAVIGAPGPWSKGSQGKNLKPDVVFGVSWSNEDGISDNTKLMVLREQQSFDYVKALVEESSRNIDIFLSGDLSMSFQPITAAMEYWEFIYTKKKYEGVTLLFSRNKNFQNSVFIEYNEQGEKVIRLKLLNSNDPTSDPVDKILMYDDVVFASSSIIEDEEYYNALEKRHGKMVKGKENFVICTQVEQLFALIKLSSGVYTDRYHPAVAAQRFNKPFEVINYAEEHRKMEGISRMHQHSADEILEWNQKAFQLLQRFLQQLSDTKENTES